MSLRAIFIAALTLAVFDIGTSSAESGESYHHRHKRFRNVYHHHKTQRLVSDGEEQKPYVQVNGSYSNSPYFDNRTFWDRVELAPDNSR